MRQLPRLARTMWVGVDLPGSAPRRFRRPRLVVVEEHKSRGRLLLPCPPPPPNRSLLRKNQKVRSLCPGTQLSGAAFSTLQTALDDGYLGQDGFTQIGLACSGLRQLVHAWERKKYQLTSIQSSRSFPGRECRQNVSEISPAGLAGAQADQALETLLSSKSWDDWEAHPFRSITS